MRILVLTAIYPSARYPALGTFVRTQVEAVRVAGVDTELLVLPREGPVWRRYLDGTRAMRARLATGRFDLVHAHYSYMGVLARLQRLVPVVVTFHGSDLHGKVSDESGRYSATGRLAVALGQSLAPPVDAAIVQSQEMAGKLRPSTRVHVIPHEVDMELFRPMDRLAARRELGLADDTGYVLFAADPRRRVKRYALARAALDRLQASGHRVQLCVVHGEPQSRVPLYMNACDALVLTSFHEGSPNVVKQAMACNVPVVSTDVGDVRQLVGRTEGCSITPPDADALATRLAPLVRKPRRTNGREAVGHLAKELVAERIVDVYSLVLRQSAATTSRPVSTGHQPQVGSP